MPRAVPMKQISAAYACLRAPAIARAGMTWPPVPPPAIMTRILSVDLPGKTQQDADAGQGDEQRRSPIRDEGQGDAFGGNQSEHHADVEEGLDQDGRGDAKSQKAREDVFGKAGRPQAAITESHEQGDDGQRANQSELFGDIGKDKVGVWLRQVEELLPAFHKAEPAYPAGADRDQRSEERR